MYLTAPSITALTGLCLPKRPSALGCVSKALCCSKGETTERSSEREGTCMIPHIHGSSTIKAIHGSINVHSSFLQQGQRLDGERHVEI